MSSAYSDVDAQDDPADLVRWQERIDAWPAIAAYKACVRARLGATTARGPVVDVGCGPGGDLVALAAEGRTVVGVDPSLAMCTNAASLGMDVCRADGHALPFATRSCAGAGADRVLQHVAAPDVALAELRRVVRPGGRVVVADPDQETLVIDVPGVDRAITDRLKVLRRDLGYRNGRLASTLPARFGAVGLVEVSVDAFALVLTDPDDAFGLPTWTRYWSEEGDFTDDDHAVWDRAMARARADGLVYAVTYLVVAGTVPPH